jgi:hypothetical protein
VKSNEVSSDASRGAVNCCELESASRRTHRSFGPRLGAMEEDEIPGVSGAVE